jgi:hypothetical protein
MAIIKKMNWWLYYQIYANIELMAIIKKKLNSWLYYQIYLSKKNTVFFIKKINIYSFDIFFKIINAFLLGKTLKFKTNQCYFIGENLKR